MNLTIRTRHADADAAFKKQAETKIARLERWLHRLDDVTVEVSREDTRAAADRFAVEITVHSGPTVLRAEERAADQLAALEQAADVLARQARRHKTRFRDHHHERKKEAARADASDMADELASDDADEYIAGQIVRVKRFEAKPMSQEEALAQMDLLGHDFFLFLDAGAAEPGAYALLYKRKDGGYGLIAPSRG